jgi:hypothetical protein
MSGRWHRRWQVALQLLVPGFILHECWHYIGAQALAADARLVLTPQGRLQCATAWRPETAAWRRVLVAFAPAIVGLCALPGVVMAVGVGPGDRLALWLWLWLNLGVLGAPSGADVALARRAPDASAESGA